MMRDALLAGRQPRFCAFFGLVVLGLGSFPD
jgi:hypothetical protein